MSRDGRRQSGDRKVCCIRWVRAVYARIYRRVHKLSSHYRSPRNTLYVCKIAKTNAVPTTSMLRRWLYARGSGSHDTVVCRFYIYDRSLMKRGQLCQLGADYLVEGPRRRCPFAAVGCRRFRSPSVINSPMVARRLHSFSTSVGRSHVDQFCLGQMEIVTTQDVNAFNHAFNHFMKLLLFSLTRLYVKTIVEITNLNIDIQIDTTIIKYLKKWVIQYFKNLQFIKLIKNSISLVLVKNISQEKEF